MSAWVYIKSEPTLFTVGHYMPNGEWFPESDHAKESEAAKRVNYLNGGIDAKRLEALAELEKVVGQFLNRDRVAEPYLLAEQKLKTAFAKAKETRS